MAHDVVAEIRAGGGVAVPDNHDIASETGAAEVVKSALEAFGRLDIVVNNAGILRDATFHKMTVQQCEAVRQGHLDGTAFVTSRLGLICASNATAGWS